MESKTINEIGQLISNYYKEKIEEKIELPRKKKVITKTIEVDEPIHSTEKVIEKNYKPGLITMIMGAVVSLIILAFSGVFAIVVFILAITVGGVLIFINKKEIEVDKVTIKKVHKEVEEEILEPVEYEFRKEPNKYSVKSIKRINLSFYLVKIDGKTLIVPNSWAVKPDSYKYPTIEKFREFKKNDAEIEEQTENIPSLLTGETEEQNIKEETIYGKKVKLRGYEKDLNNYFENTEFWFSNKKKTKFEIPLFYNSNIVEYYKESKENWSNSHAESLLTLIYSEQGIELDDYLINWEDQWVSRMLLTNKIRINSLQNEMSPELLELGQLSQYTSFNFYCPSCNLEIQKDLLSRDYSVQGDSEPAEIHFSKNTRCKFNPVKNIWVCNSCGQSIKQPIPVHKSLDELIMPIYDKLMEENKVEREKHHSEMRKREIEMRYKMKEELEKIYFDHISGIFELQSSMDKMSAEIGGESEAIYYLEKISKEQKELESKIIDNIIRENIEMNKRIKEREVLVEKRLSEYTKAELKSYGKEMDVLSKAKRIEDEKKHAEIHGTLQQINETNKQGFANVVDAQKETTAAVHETTSAVKENTQVTKEGFEETNKNLKRGNAIQMAMARKQGVNLNDNGPFRILKNASNSMTDAWGTVTGKSTVEKEEAKLN